MGREREKESLALGCFLERPPQRQATGKQGRGSCVGCVGRWVSGTFKFVWLLGCAVVKEAAESPRPLFFSSPTMSSFLLPSPIPCPSNLALTWASPPLAFSVSFPCVCSCAALTHSPGRPTFTHCKLSPNLPGDALPSPTLPVSLNASLVFAALFCTVSCSSHTPPTLDTHTHAHPPTGLYTWRRGSSAASSSTGRRLDLPAAPPSSP